MKKLITVITLSLALLVGVSPAQALLSGDTETTLVISNLVGVAGDGKVDLTWESSPDQNGNPAAKFVVHVGAKSVAGGLATKYDKTYEATEKKISITGLTNGSPLYFAVNAVGANGTAGSVSNEITLTPVGATTTATTVTPTTDAPTVLSAIAKTKTTVVVEFSEDIVLPKESPEISFSIAEEKDDSKFLLVWSAEYDVENKGEATEKEVHNRVVLVTDEQEKGKSYAVTVSAIITDEKGNPIESGVTDSAVFTGTDLLTPVEDPAHAAATDAIAEEVIVTDTTATPAVPNPETTTPPADVTPPADITGLVITFKAKASDFLISLSWKLSADAANELVEQIVYHSLDKGATWDAGKALGKDVATYETAGAPETEHTFKITTRDQAGNESVGVIQSVRLPALPSTGPVALIAVGAGFLLAGASRLRKK